jgi:cytochrome P450
MREVARHLLEQIPAQGAFDLVNTLSSPLPTIVIAELLGVEPEWRDDFKRWVNNILPATNGIITSPEARESVRQSLSELFGRKRRTKPSPPKKC